MKTQIITSLAFASFAVCCSQGENVESAQSNISQRRLYLDVHDIGGTVTFAAVADAHKKDLATQGEFDVQFIKYWVDERGGKVYCLAEASSEANVFRTHEKAHGLVPDYIMEVKPGMEARGTGRQLFLDVHNLVPGAVTAEAVAGAHDKDLKTQGKYNVNFLNYWVDERAGTVVCLSEADDSLAVIHTHGEAHGLIPAKIMRVKQGE